MTNPVEVPSQFATQVQWPPDLAPTAAESPALTAAWLYYLSGAGQAPQMPQDWQGGSERWDAQMQFVQKSVAAAKQQVGGAAGGRGAPPAPATGSQRAASAAPAGRGKKIVVGLLVVSGVGAGIAWLVHRRKRGAGQALHSAPHLGRSR